ncbi:MAG: response regulator [Pseudomonadota bacterium]
MSRVLLAEDEFLIRAALAEALDEVGLTCIEAPTGAAALDVVTGSGELAAIIVDIGLPDMSGEKVIEAARRHRPDVPVIRCSGAILSQGDGGSGIHVFPKPYSPTDLSRFVASLVGTLPKPPS